VTDTGWIEKAIALVDHRSVDNHAVKASASAELAALRAENEAQARQIAALREALEECVSEIAELASDGEYALSSGPRGKSVLDSVSPSSMRLVPLERLREIEWSGDEDGWPSCPACGGLQGCAHKPDCWLGKLIAGKETEPLTRDTIR